jgi:ribonuclease HI
LGIKLRYAVRLQFTRETNRCTNNIVEYEAMSCILKIDSKVIAR